MSGNPLHEIGRSGSTVRHSKEDALSDREFELLLEGARRMNTDYYYKHDPEFIILVLGRLGLRRGEIAYMKEEWINWKEQMISIPDYEKCTKGENGGVCGYCQQLARQRAEVNEELTFEKAKQWMWVPKTKAAARDIYFGFDTRVEMAIERYFSSPEYNEVSVSSTAINRRVKKSAKLANKLTPKNLSPHKLRATAASHLVGRGIKTLPLMQMFGWVSPETAEVYVARSGQNTANQLDSLNLK